MFFFTVMFTPFKGSPTIKGVVCLGDGKHQTPQLKRRMQVRFPQLKEGAQKPGFVFQRDSDKLYVSYVRWNCNSRRYNNHWDEDRNGLVYRLPSFCDMDVIQAINHTIKNNERLFTNVIALRDGKAYDLGTFKIQEKISTNDGGAVFMKRVQMASHS